MKPENLINYTKLIETLITNLNRKTLWIFLCKTIVYPCSDRRIYHLKHVIQMNSLNRYIIKVMLRKNTPNDTSSSSENQNIIGLLLTRHPK
jgi:hypothetical protein